MQLRKTLVAAAAAALLVIGLPSTAQAGSVDNTRAAEEAPSCIDRDLWDPDWTDYLQLTNYCGVTYRVKVILEHADNSGCTILSPGELEDYEWSYPGRYVRTEVC
jgi:hypothetical protein